MHDPRRLRQRFALAAAGTVVVVWGVLGLFQARGSGQAGYRTRWGGEVDFVNPDGPAAAAGLKVGDRIVSLDGTALDSPWTFPSRDRLKPGRVQTLGVEREEEETLVEITWSPLTAAQVKQLYVDALVTLAFFALSLWAFLRSGTRAGLLLAVFGLCYGLANFPAPALGLPGEAVAFVRGNLSLFYTALLCHFLAVFPVPKKILGRRWAGRVLYAPFLVFLIFGFAGWLLFPSSLAAYPTAAAFVDLLYMLLALVALVHTWVGLPRGERRESGFHFIPLGLLLAIVPFLVLGIVGMIVPGFVLPGRDLLPLLGILIPAGLSLAVVTDGRRR